MVDAAEDVMTQAIQAFVPLLEKRLSAGIFTTEDSVRYTFFAALLHAGVQPEQVILEARYPAMLETDTERKQLDLLLCSSDQGRQVAAAEFKYDRAIPGGKHSPRTQKAGKLFADLRRLLLWLDPIARYFIYLTDRELYNYLKNPANQLAHIFTPSHNHDHSLTTELFTPLAVTFHTAMGQWTQQASLRVLANEALPADHHLWIFAIQSDPTNP